MSTRVELSGPYPGLRPFEEREWRVFFGRESMIDDVLDRLATNKLVVVHGSSGCGKSSLIRAGIIPQLKREHGLNGISWRAAEMRPGSSPLWNLATALARLVENLDNDQEPSLSNVRTLRRLLTGGRAAWDRIQKQFDLCKHGNVCILLDQFEELFRYARETGREEAEGFIEVMLGFHEGMQSAGRRATEGIHIVLTMRSDHLGDCGHFEGFAELVNATQYLLPRMREDALMRAIREPARLFGGEVSVELCIRMIEESRSSIDSLPLIQHTLMRLWTQVCEKRDSVSRSAAGELILDEHGYQGLEAMMSQHGEEVLQSIETEQPGAIHIAEHLFRAITAVDDEGRGIRRPQSLSKLIAITGEQEHVTKRVVARFAEADCGFVVSSRGESPVIDLGHEAVIRCWRRLYDTHVDEVTAQPLGWVERERQDGQLWRALTVTVTHDFPTRVSLFGVSWGGQLSTVLKPRLQWFKSLPSPRWADRYGGQHALIADMVSLTRDMQLWNRIALLGGVLFYGLLSVGAILNAESRWKDISQLLIVASAPMLLLLALALPINKVRFMRRYNRSRSRHLAALEPHGSPLYSKSGRGQLRDGST